MLHVSYDPLLVVASVLVAIMGSFTGLRLTSGLGQLEPIRRKPEIAKAAIALGGGIWSMHFVGMLAVRVGAQIEYGALATLGSVLVAILITGLGLIILHFGDRTPAKIISAGVLMGLGIVSMHYLGMSAIGGNCIVSYEPVGYFLSTGISIGSSICALWLTYTRRTLLQTAVGSVMLGITISAMHYSAMIYTRFDLAVEVTLIGEPVLSSGIMALLVALAAFLICGLFLLTAIPTDGRVLTDVVAGTSAPAAMSVTPVVSEDPIAVADAEVQRANGGVAEATDDPAPALIRLPYQQNNVTHFIPASHVVAVKADGHYTRIQNKTDEYFCPWPISRVEDHLEQGSFLRTHRSYLVNINHIAGFHRAGDKAFCVMDASDQREIPVSRAKVPQIRQILGLD